MEAIIKDIFYCSLLSYILIIMIINLLRCYESHIKNRQKRLFLKNEFMEYDIKSKNKELFKIKNILIPIYKANLFISSFLFFILLINLFLK